MIGAIALIRAGVDNRAYFPVRRCLDGPLRQLEEFRSELFWRSAYKGRTQVLGWVNA
jgi:hypothetical protein